jgi:hypothetical protein
LNLEISVTGKGLKVFIEFFETEKKTKQALSTQARGSKTQPHDDDDEDDNHKGQDTHTKDLS